MKELHMPRTALVTGFEPFNGASLNPSQEIVNELARTGITGIKLHTSVLPCVFSKASSELLNLIEKIQPDVVIALGQAEGRSQITPEQIAINLDDARIPDNQGEKRLNKKIVDDGDDGYFSTLPITEIIDAMNAAGIPTIKSLSAGTFLCNNVFYSMQHAMRNRSIRSGFIHLPLMRGQESEFPGQPTLELSLMVKAIDIAVTVASAR